MRSWEVLGTHMRREGPKQRQPRQIDEPASGRKTAPGPGIADKLFRASDAVHGNTAQCSSILTASEHGVCDILLMEFRGL
eukprot:2015521-Pyramimonas_sp.AAC.1